MATTWPITCAASCATRGRWWTRCSFTRDASRPRLVETYAAQGSHPVRLDRAALRAVGVELIEADLLAPGGEAARHDGRKVAEVLLERLR